MPITQSVNSKANVKRQTTNDLPFSAQQPVINSFYATSTAGQTVINFGFSIQTTGVFANTDVFWLFVDGKKLDLGSTNDYQFTSVGSDGTSSQVTLNFPLPVNLNIQAFKLGLKPEIQFGMDNRFVQLYAAQSAGFQGFVSQTDFINTATTTTGTPVAGTFYSTVVNRAPMVDLSQDLKVRMGVERIPTQSVQVLQNEFGPNGENVSTTPNDIFGQVRFVGNWVTSFSSNGQRAEANNPINDYVEVTIYGTGLNMFTTFDNGAVAYDYRASVDGGSEGGQLLTQTPSAVLELHGYSPNHVVPVVSGLSLGIHTIKIRCNSANGMPFCGFEILNESTTVKVSSGVSYLSGQKASVASQSTFSYNSAVTGTTGGRVLVYETSSGAVGTAFTQNAVSSSSLASTSHTNEEVARTYYWREFGSGQATDFSIATGTSTSRAFTLEDGTTALQCDSFVNGANDTLRITTTGNILTFTFIGTGLDILRVAEGTGTANVLTVTIDGVSAGNTTAYSVVAGQPVHDSICSGLPYGSHVVRFTKTATGSVDHSFRQLIVYQPKKPALPSGAIELADYNVMATYSDSGLSTSYLTLPVGGMWKSPQREAIYSGTGTWSLDTPAQAYSGPSGIAMFNNASVSGPVTNFTFVGTGIALLISSNSGGTKTYTVAIDGTLNSSGSVFGGATNSGGGTYTSPSGSALARWISFQGLSYGKHTVTLTCTDTTGFNVIFDGFVVNPLIHSYKSNVYVDLQNSLSIGSNGISDNRKITPVKDALPAQKAWSQAVGIASSPSTTSGSFVPVPDMSTIIKTNGGPLKISWEIDLANSIATDGWQLATYVDGAQVGTVMSENEAVANSIIGNTYAVKVAVAPGYHKVDLAWLALTGGTLTAIGTRRILTVEET